MCACAGYIGCATGMEGLGLAFGTPMPACAAAGGAAPGAEAFGLN